MALYLYGKNAIINFSHKKDKWLKKELNKFAEIFNHTPKGQGNIYFDKRRKKWCARIQHNKKTIFIGRFNSLEEAEIAKSEKFNSLKNERK